MNLKDKDMNLLHLFSILYEERNLSRAAERMSLSQPTLSHRLSKLRTEFGDPLFERAPRGLSITPKAEAYAPEIIRLVKSFESLYSSMSSADMHGWIDKVSIYGTEISEAFIIPEVIGSLSISAPSAQISMFNTLGTLPAKELEKGTCDIAIVGSFRSIPDSFYIQKLCSLKFVVLAHKDNINIGDVMTVDSFVKCDHVIVTRNNDLLAGVDKALSSIGRGRRVVAGYSSFLAPQFFLKHRHDVLFVCMSPVANLALQFDDKLVTHKCPIDIPAVEMSQVWHERTHHDPFRKWIRQEIRKSALTL